MKKLLLFVLVLVGCQNEEIYLSFSKENNKAYNQLANITLSLDTVLQNQQLAHSWVITLKTDDILAASKNAVVEDLIDKEPIEYVMVFNDSIIVIQGESFGKNMLDRKADLLLYCPKKNVELINDKLSSIESIKSIESDWYHAKCILNLAQ